MQITDESRMAVRIEKIDRFPDDGAQTAGAKAKKASEAGKELLQKILQEEFAIDLTKEKDPFGKEPGGKPYLRHHREIFFNISHSGEYAACVAATGQVGIDIQYHKDTDIRKLAKKTLSEEEWEIFAKAGYTAEQFYYFWTKKESFLKYTGEGIRSDLRKLDYKNYHFIELELPVGYSGMVCISENIFPFHQHILKTKR